MEKSKSAEVSLDGYVEIIIKDVNSESEIWAVKCPSPNLVFEKRDLLSPNDIKRKSKDRFVKTDFSPTIGSKCAYSMNNAQWIRAEILSGDKSNYKIFLIDNGQCTIAKIDSLLPLPEKLQQIPPLAFRINFYGIQPTCMQFSDDLNMSLLAKECSDWQPFHMNYLRNVFQRSKKVHFKEIKKVKEEVKEEVKNVKKVKEVTYGIVVIETEKDVFNLNDELVEKKCANKIVKPDSVYERLHEKSNKPLHTKKDKLKCALLDVSNVTNASRSSCSSDNEEKRPLSCSSGSILNTSTESLLKAAFGDKATLKVSPSSYKSDELNVTIDEKPSKSNRHRSLRDAIEKICITDDPSDSDDVKNIPSIPKDQKLYVSSDNRRSDHISESEEMISPSKNIDSDSSFSEPSFREDPAQRYRANRLTLNAPLCGKPMSTNVQMLYEKYSKLNKKKESVTETESSNTESDHEVIQHLKNRSQKKFYTGALLHQSPTITENIEPTEQLIDTDINENIHKVLEARRRRDLSQLQMFAYPILTKYHNLVVVSNPRSGKSLASVVSILSLLCDTTYYNNLKEGCGPKAIFLVSFYQNVRTIEKLCSTLLLDQRGIRVKSAYGGDAVNQMKVDLAEGCDVLITTPRCLLRLLEVKFVTNLYRLCHLIFDDADFLFDNFLWEIQLILKGVDELESIRKQNYKVQKVILAERWTPVLEKIVVNNIKDGFICIPTNNLLEAAVYSRVRPNIQFLKPENKCSTLIELIKPIRGMVRTVIVCQNEEEAEQLQKQLDPVLSSGRLLVSHEGKDHISIGDIRRAWLDEVEGLHTVMICTDDVMTELSITNADRLIHYSLPYSKTSFSSRFMCLEEKYCNIFKKETSPSCKVYIFVDEDNDEQFPEIVSLMKRLKYTITEKIENVVNRINYNKENEKKEIMLCENFKQYGECWRITKCHYRHVFLPEIDEIQDFPKSGFVKLKVVYVHGANHFSVILLEHKVGKTWKKLPGVDQCAVIALKMNSAFQKESDRELHPSPRIGDRVAIETKNNSDPRATARFQRACIIEILKFDEKRRPSSVNLKLLETGEVIESSVYDLYYLPEELRKLPPQAADVYTCRLQPTDLDKYWSYSALKCVYKWLVEADKAIENYGDSHYLCGRIVLSVGRNLWLDPMTHSEWLQSVETEINHHSFRHALMENKLAIDKSDHLELLYKCCTVAGLKTPKIAKEPVKIEENNSKCKVQWAHLNRDEFTDVCLVDGKNPGQLFLRIPKFQDRLDELQNDISKEKILKVKDGDLKIGDLCLAFFPEDNSWNRAKVLSFPSADKVEVFYADHGNFYTLSWDQLGKISNDLINRLPLQAIECRLAGIQALNDNGWSSNAMPILYELSEIKEGLWKTLVACVYELELKAEITGGRKYAVALLDVEEDPILVLNKSLVIEAEANWRMEEKQWLDTVCDNYIKSLNGDQSEELEQEEEEEEEEEKEDWDKECENDNKIVAVKSSLIPDSYDHSSSIIDENLKQLYKVLEDDDNFECDDLQAMFMDVLKVKPKLNNEDVLEKISKSNNKCAVLSLPTSKPAIFSLPKKKSGVSAVIKNYPEISVHEKTKRKSIDSNRGKSKIRLSVKSNELSDSRSTVSSNTEDTDELDINCDNPPPLKTICSVHTPSVLWYQNLEFVWIHIKLIDVTKYNIKWSHRTLCFSTWNEGKYFRIDFNLFGPIYPEYLQHSAKGFRVEIKMKKVLYGFTWCRLLQTKARYNWLKVNPDHVNHSSEDSDEENSIKDELEKNNIKFDKSIKFCTPRPPGLSDSDSNSSDVVEPNDLDDDPDDPLNIN